MLYTWIVSLVLLGILNIVVNVRHWMTCMSKVVRIVDMPMAVQIVRKAMFIRVGKVRPH